MYQPYPGGNQNPSARRPPAPLSVQIAVKFMYAGAAMSLIALVVSFTAVSTIRRALQSSSVPFTASELNELVNGLVVLLVVLGVILTGIWLWLAHYCLRGRNWARITGTVLFAIYTLTSVGNLGFAGPAAVRVYDLADWLVALGAVAFLWRRDSSAYFKPSG
jgi:hypothetical protein